ncbi:FAD-dependent monooxygenase [Streptomyces sp. NPDC020858]|uniref:FAD-dependent monooxygenase n=1 Tax=Streptomyces sp. NPDC020858 TaxID=3365097 RepID=UPI00378EC13B
METDVIVIGAGPAGLTLAAELRLGGADVVVFEQRAERSWESRGIGFTARATEMFHQRGILERLENIEITRQGHFGGIPIDYGVLKGSHFGVRGAPQYKIEEMLENRALELGVTLRRGYELTGLTDTGDGVTAVVEGPDGPEECSARYLVGCDGGRSTVRRLVGIEFAGSDATREMYLADVSGCDIKPRMIGELLPNGMVMAAPLEQGYTRIIVCENGTPPDRSREVTFTQVADAWQRLTGDSIHHGETRWVSSFTDATRQATEYRRGRVLLAGDSAHIHLPAGGQGLSVGVQDAFNLGWKLAATVKGWAPEGLLDTYHAERHPVGARVLRNTLAQGTLNLTGRSVEPMRSVMAELIAIPAVARHLSGTVSGFDIAYRSDEADGPGADRPAHPLLGTRMADRELELADGGQDRIARLLHPARGVLITSDASGDTGRTAAGWSDRVDVVRVKSFPAGPEEAGAATESVLLRPDGYIAWTAPDGGGLAAALRRWFGEAR